MSVSLRTPHMFLEDSLRSQAFAIITPSVITRLPSKPVLGHCVNFEAPESSEDGQRSWFYYLFCGNQTFSRYLKINFYTWKRA